MELLILFVLILCNSFFALSEIALVSSKKARLEQSRAEGSKGAKTALKLQENSGNFLSAIQVGITLIGIVTGVYGGMNIADDVEPIFRQVGFLSQYSYEFALALTILIITYISIVIGELVPKTIALNNPEKIAVIVAPVIFYFSTLFFPFVWILSVSTKIITNLIGIKKKQHQFSEAELRNMIKIASDEGVIEEEQNIIHEKIFYFSDKRAKHIMTHRTNIEWIDLDATSDQIIKKLTEINHSKIICCKGTLDNFIGVIYVRDYYKSVLTKKEPNFNELLIQPIILPENADAQDVLKQFREKKIHICVVVNEYGGFEGIITMHDIIENIVGQIPDEGESYEPDIFVREDNSVLVSGNAPVETLTEIIEDFMVDFEQIDYSTVAGFVFNKINKIPEIGDKIEFMGYFIEIVDVDGNKIDKILISKI